MQTELEQAERQRPTLGIHDIAVIGLSGCYPQAANVDQFWKNLKNGKNCITEIPQNRWDWREYFDGQKGRQGKIYTKWGGFIEGADHFDPLFFQISPREAERIDPQERLFLEVAYSCIEDAGYTPATLGETGTPTHEMPFGKKVGVFVGVMNGTYTPQPSHWSIANRISYLFDFHGPSMAVDTACSSSLTAIHLAMESLYNETSNYAIAGGVNLILDPIHYMGLTEITMLSVGNLTKSFGDQADGFVDGEGAGAILLKTIT